MLLAALMVTGLAGCGGGGGGGAAPGGGGATTGTINGTVRDGAGNLVTNFTAQTAAGGGTATITGAGTFTITNVAPGAQTVTVSQAGFTTGQGGANVTAGATTNVNITVAAPVGDTPPPPPF